MSENASRKATASSWKRLPEPDRKEDLQHARVFSLPELERLEVGYVPEAMEDKWFIYFENGWLRFHRSWTGACIYGLKVQASPVGGRISESWANRDAEQYRRTDAEYDRRLVDFLIDAFLLKKEGIKFPMPENSADLPKGLLQHSVVGRGYPEADTETKP